MVATHFAEPQHSWNTNHIYSNLILFHLQRHSDHHANALRPYQALRDFDNLPRLPMRLSGLFRPRRDSAVVVSSDGSESVGVGGRRYCEGECGSGKACSAV